MLTINPCGHTCDYCPSYLGQSENNCPGCLDAKGNPWWGICKVFECVSSKNLQHCGTCHDFPCDILINHYDPENPQGQRNAVIRTGILAYRVRHDDSKTRELIERLRVNSK